MKKILEKAVLIIAFISIVLSADYILRFSWGKEDKSLLAYILNGGQYLLSLVNKQNTLEAYAPNDLVGLSSLGAPGKQIRKIAYNDLAKMLKDAKKEGVKIKIISAYRSYPTQKSLFSFYSKNFNNASRFSAEAGHSEHQLGTTLDFGVGDSNIDLTAAFASTSQGEWLKNNAHKYGFVLSYPKDKETVTGYIYEPWHYRFIGVYSAKEFMQSGLTLQEFLSQKPQYYK